MKKILLPITLFFCFLSAKAEIKLPNIIGSNMVIQQNAGVRFWGKAAKNAKELYPNAHISVFQYRISDASLETICEL
jgi:hypothetical protein